MSNTKISKNNQKKQVGFMEFKSEFLPTMNTNNGRSGNSIIVQKFNRNVPIQLKRSSISLKQQVNNTTSIPSINNTTNNKTQSGFEKLNQQKTVSLNDTITSELRTIENQETLNLLDKIRQSAIAEPIGPMPLSLQACRFELPFDLKLLETLTPLDYLTKYCRLSSRRQYQFKRIFDKYRNRHYQFESSYLYLSLVDIHKHHLTYKDFDYLCQLIDLGHQQYQFIFDTYAGILALCERILYKSSILYKDQDDYDLTEDAIEKCDFYSLDRKFDGLMISDTMKRLLHAL